MCDFYRIISIGYKFQFKVKIILLFTGDFCVRDRLSIKQLTKTISKAYQSFESIFISTRYV